MSFRKRLKKILRKRIALHERYVTRYVRPAAAAAASYFGGPVAGAAVTAATHYAHQWAAGVTQRSEGKHGLEARQKARAQAKRTSIYSAYATGVGSLASGITTAALGGSFGQSVSAAGAGQWGANALGNNATLFATQARDFSTYANTFVTAGNLNAQPASSIPGLVTESSLKASLGGAAASGGTATASTAATAATTAATTILGKVLGGSLGRGPDRDPGMSFPTGGGGSGGGGGDSGLGGGGYVGDSGKGGDASGLLPLAIIGGVLLLMSA